MANLELQAEACHSLIQLRELIDLVHDNPHMNKNALGTMVKESEILREIAFLSAEGGNLQADFRLPRLIRKLQLTRNLLLEKLPVTLVPQPADKEPETEPNLLEEGEMLCPKCKGFGVILADISVTCPKCEGTGKEKILTSTIGQ